MNFLMCSGESGSGKKSLCDFTSKVSSSYYDSKACSTAECTSCISSQEGAGGQGSIR